MTRRQPSDEQVAGLVVNLREMAMFKHDDLTIGDEAADAIESLLTRVGELEAHLAVCRTSRDYAGNRLAALMPVVRALVEAGIVLLAHRGHKTSCASCDMMKNAINREAALSKNEAPRGAAAIREGLAP